MVGACCIAVPGPRTEGKPVTRALLLVALALVGCQDPNAALRAEVAAGWASFAAQLEADGQRFKLRWQRELHDQDIDTGIPWAMTHPHYYADKCSTTWAHGPLVLRDPWSEWGTCGRSRCDCFFDGTKTGTVNLGDVCPSVLPRDVFVWHQNEMRCGE